MDRLPTQTKRYVNSLNLSGQVSHAVLFVRHGYPLEIELACKGKPAGDRGYDRCRIQSMLTPFLPVLLPRTCQLRQTLQFRQGSRPMTYLT